MTDITKLLIRLLEDEHPSKRSAAAIILGEMAPEGPAVLDALRQASAREGDATLRRWVVEAFGRIAPSTIVTDLQPLLKDGDRKVRAAVKNVLSTCRSVKESEIADMLEGNDDRERLAAIGVLGAMGTSKARKTLLSHLPGASSKVSSAIIDAIRPSMAEADDRSRKAVVHELDLMLVDDVMKSDPDFAMVAAQLLGHTGQGEMVNVLLRLAQSQADDEVRVVALETMQRTVRARKPKLFAALLDLVESEASASVHDAALNVLENLEIPVPSEARVRALATVDSTHHRRWALKALGGLDTAPAAETLAKVVDEGVAEDREIALESAGHTANGRAALARLLGRLTDVDRASQITHVLRQAADGLTPDTRHALENAVMEAVPEVGRLILDVLQAAGGGEAAEVKGNLLEKAVLLKNKGKYGEAIALLKSLSQGVSADPEAKFLLGICELKTSKRKIVRGHNHDACLDTFAGMLRHKDYPLLERLAAEKVLEPSDLYYLGFSLAERTDAAQGFGGDVLTHLVETAQDKDLAHRAQNKLKTMGWIE